MSLKTARSKYNIHLVEYVSNNMDWTSTKKYTEKMCDFIENRGVLDTYTNENLMLYFNTLEKTFKLFDRYSINFEKKDIMQYKTFEEFIDSVEKYITEFTPVKIRNMMKVDGKLNPGVNLGRFGDYDVVRIDDFKDASAYSGICSWCVTKDKSTFTTYTSGEKQFYFLLKKDFESKTKIRRDNSPFDDYGLSMLAVRVFMDGFIEITTRWNHDYFYDHTLTNNIEFLIKIVGDEEIKKVIVPKKNEDLVDFNLLIKIVKLRLKFGVLYQNIFNSVYQPRNGFSIVGLLNRENLINIETNEFICDGWFDAVFNFVNFDGIMLSQVFLNGRSNLLTTEGNLLSDYWYRDINKFKNYFIVTETNDLYNSMDFNGKILNEKWFTSYVAPRNMNTPFLMVKYGKDIEYLNEKGILMIRK